MAKDKKRRGLGSGLGALIPPSQKEKTDRPIDVFFGNESKPVMPTVAEEVTNKNVSRETFAETQPVNKAQYVSVEPIEKAPEPVENIDDGDLVPVPGASYAEIPLNQIIPNRDQPRSVFDEEELEELSQSIQEVGVLQPIVVRPLPDKSEEHPDARYELIMGERRWRASTLGGMETIPAIIRRTTDEDLLRDALLENLHRVDLNPLEEAAAYQQLLDDFQCTQEELSQKIARSRPQITNTLRLLKLPALVQRRVAAGVLTAGHARALLGLSDPGAMEALAQRIVAENLSVRQVEEIVATYSDEDHAHSEKIPQKKRQTEYKNVASKLSDLFDTRVKVTMGKNKGSVKIDFATPEDLQRILQVINPHVDFSEDL